jgi:hypothetical protein
MDPAVRGHANEIGRNYYWRTKGIDPATTPRPVQHCHFCGDPLAEYKPDKEVRACAKKACRNQYYALKRKLKKEQAS